MPSRLDRETSGVFVLAADRETGRRLQNSVLHNRVHKTYTAIVEGELSSQIVVDQPIGQDARSEFFSRRGVHPDGQRAVTEFVPVARRGGYTLVKAYPRTGRRHQIRVHAAWLGHPVVGDKLYGRDPRLMLRLMDNGFLDDELAALPMPRHALHASEVIYGDERFEAPLLPDMEDFWEQCQSGR
jgi:23S rRNA pseudouridine1911/1915/1917 synthase